MEGKSPLVACAFAGGMLCLGPWLAAAPLRVGPVFAGHFPTVEVVLDPGGGAPADGSLPAAADLTLVEDGKPTVSAGAVRPFGQTDHGLSVVVAVDVSGSMAGAPIAEIRRALAALLRNLGPHDRAALVSFADDVKVEAPFGTSSEGLRAAVEGLTTRGRITELYRALFKSFDQLTPEAGGRPRLIVVSDGKDEGKAYTLEDVISRARSSEIPVDAIGLTRIDPAYLSTLERLADLSGGHYSRAADAKDLEGLVLGGLEQVRATPVASFTAQALPRDGESHRLGVRWRNGGRILEGETSLVVPLAEAQSEKPGQTPAPPEAPGQEAPWTLTLPLLGAVPWHWILVALLLILLVAAAIWLARRRRRPVPAPPSLEPPVVTAESPPVFFNPPPTEAAAELRVEPPPAVSAGRRKTQIRHEIQEPAAGHPAAVLMAEDGIATGSRFPIEKDQFWIGAEEGNDLRVTGDDFLSSHHACIRFVDGSLLLYDNRSTNGTFVNGERLAEVPRPIDLGDRVRVGHSTFVVMAP